MTGAEGQDWAGYQKSRPSTKGLGFAFVKATEGTTFTNPRRASQVATARADGLVVGHYHFARPGSMTAQADYFLAQAGAKPGDVLAFDWEDPGVSDQEKDAWLRYVQAKAPHNRVILYCNRDYWLHRDSTSFCADGLWIADPSAPKGQPRITSDWLFHQYSEAGGIDRNYCPLTGDQLRAWAAGPSTPQHEEDDVQLTDKITVPKGNPLSPGGQTATVGDWIAYGNLKAGAALAAVKSLTAQTAALTAAVAALAHGGGLTAAEITAAAKAGADAALDQLGDALKED